MDETPTSPLMPLPDDDGGGGAGARRGVGLEQAGDEIGPYKLISELGEGGFAVVWLAERRRPFVQRVALKLIKPGMDSKAVVARFEQERQALAVMNHPHIAKVLDGGVSPSGRPYFAMELVKGEPITSYCDAERLPIERRLELFAQVCDAVQHAHVKGIIHRDLKPSNVLVSRGEGDRAVVKVIDFGVAKALTQRLTERTVFTETGQMIGTPEYMSPEQAEPDATDIDTRSDVYSLGVLLYELLVGALPFEPSELRSKAYREIQRIIREEPAPAPSTRLTGISTQDRARAESIARNRRALEGELSRRLRSELEWIPLKAMKKSREERYGSPQELGEDVRRYLRGERLSAGPDSAAYRLRKQLVRNERSTAVGLILGAGASLLLCIALRRLSYGTWVYPMLFAIGIPLAAVAGAGCVLLASTACIVDPRRETVWRRLFVGAATSACGAGAVVVMFSSRRAQPSVIYLATACAMVVFVALALFVLRVASVRRCVATGVISILVILPVNTAIWALELPVAVAIYGVLGDWSAEPAPPSEAPPSEPPVAKESMEISAFEVLSSEPDPVRVMGQSDRDRLRATGLPWRVRHRATGVVLLLAPPGSFLMGSPETDPGRRDDERQHERRIERPFYLSERAVTQGEFARLAYCDEGRDEFDPEAPQAYVTPILAATFVVNSRGVLRLPSEAEWEYACLAGASATESPLGKPAEDQAELGDEGNPWGFREMLGGVATWCSDTYATYPDAGTALRAWSPDGAPVMRGGRRGVRTELLRPTARFAPREDEYLPMWDIGLRVACDVETVRSGIASSGGMQR